MITVDSSSLILMAKLSILDKVLENTKQEILITEEVNTECTIKSTFDAKLIQKRIEENLIKIKELKNKSKYSRIVKDFNLGKGEESSIALCLENNIELITDDKKAINTCKIFKIRFTTVPNIIVKMSQKGILTSQQAYTYLEKLEKIGRYKKEIIEKAKGELKWRK